MSMKKLIKKFLAPDGPIQLSDLLMSPIVDEESLKAKIVDPSELGINVPHEVQVHEPVPLWKQMSQEIADRAAFKENKKNAKWARKLYLDIDKFLEKDLYGYYTHLMKRNDDSSVLSRKKINENSNDHHEFYENTVFPYLELRFNGNLVNIGAMNAVALKLHLLNTVKFDHTLEALRELYGSDKKIPIQGIRLLNDMSKDFYKNSLLLIREMDLSKERSPFRKNLLKKYNDLYNNMPIFIGGELYGPANFNSELQDKIMSHVKNVDETKYTAPKEDGSMTLGWKGSIKDGDKSYVVNSYRDEEALKAAPIHEFGHAFLPDSELEAVDAIMDPFRYGDGEWEQWKKDNNFEDDDYLDASGEIGQRLLDTKFFLKNVKDQYGNPIFKPGYRVLPSDIGRLKDAIKNNKELQETENNMLRIISRYPEQILLLLFNGIMAKNDSTDSPEQDYKFDLNDGTAYAKKGKKLIPKRKKR